MKRFVLGLFLVVVIVAVVTSANSEAAQTYSYVPLKDNPNNIINTFANAINDYGEVVGNSWGIGWYWSPISGGAVNLPVDTSSNPTDINNNGYIIARWWTGLAWENGAFVYTQGTGKIDLPEGGYAYDINNNGDIVGWGGNNLYKWTFDGSSVTGTHNLGNPEGFSGSQGWAINDNGLILANAGIPYLVTEDQTWIDLPPLTTQGQVGYGGTDLNNNRDVVGSSTSITYGGTTAVLWPQGISPHDLGSLLTNSDAQALNEHGQIVGRSWDETETVSLATLWVKEGDHYPGLCMKSP